MPSQKHSANSGRRTHHDPTADHASPLDTLRELNSSLHKANADRDRYAAHLKDTAKKLDDQERLVATAKDHIRRLTAELMQARADNKDLEFRNLTLDTDNVRIKASYESLQLKFNALNVPDRRNPMTAAAAAAAAAAPSAIPDRTRRSAGSGTSSGSGSNSGASKAAQHDGERGRARGRDRERQEKEENKRLSTRFERRPPAAGAAPSRRASFLEGAAFGAVRRSGSAAPASRNFDKVAHTGRYDEPALSPRDRPTFSAVPRTVVPPSSSGAYYSGGSVMYDDVEDGNYHLHPIR